MPIKSRAKGNAYELSVINSFREHGYPDAVSSRSESKNADDAGIDLCYTGGYNVQCKRVERLGPLDDILANMPQAGRFSGKLNLVFSKRNRKKSVVSMTEEDFWVLHNLAMEKR